MQFEYNNIYFKTQDQLVNYIYDEVEKEDYHGLDDNFEEYLNHEVSERMKGLK